MFPRIKFSASPKIIILYKLLNDSLLVLLTFFLLTMLAEGVLPGVVSSHIGLYKIVVAIILNVLAITSIGKIIKAPEKNTNKKIVWPLFFICALLLFNSLLKLNIYLNIFILLIIFVISYFLIKVFQEEKTGL